MGSAITRGIVLRRAWDRFAIAWPFSRVDVVLGAPIEPDEDGALARLEDALHRANARAHAASGARELTCAAS